MKISEAYNIDCMELMRNTPDKWYELVIVDPPYGMVSAMDGTMGGGRIMNKWKRPTTWDIKPTKDFFSELFRVSQNQIVWGGNNFIEHLNNTTNYIFWNKKQTVNNFAPGELAWTSFPGVCSYYELSFLKNTDKIHPTQKPIALYKWLLSKFAKPGDKILDTHLGSGSSRIAAYDMGFDFYGTEIDKEYFEAQEKRFKLFTSQQKLFANG